MRKKKQQTVDQVDVIDIGEKGKAIGRLEDGRIILVENAVPGDKVSARIVGKKKGMKIGKADHFHTYSPDRDEPFCRHFEHCGGCNWQNLLYGAQLRYKENGVKQNLKRIGGIAEPEVLPIVGGEMTRHYRNKLEFTFTNKRWLTEEEIAGGKDWDDRSGLGYHVPGSFAHVLDIEECHLMPEPVNGIRNAVREYARENDLSFQDVYAKTGLLRNLILRSNRAGEFMLVLVVRRWEEKSLSALLEEIQRQFPQIVAQYYCVNQKMNDSTADLPFTHFAGEKYLTETLGKVNFRIGPKSFFQTNVEQAENLVNLVIDFAEVKTGDLVFDLYTGLGTIGLNLSTPGVRVVGIEEIEPAVDDARENASLNGLEEVEFICGDVKDTLKDELIATYGIPDVLITDPPRAGMHPDAINFILQILPERIVYVSCNPSTQARDIALLREKYQHVKSRPVDMFPHTGHIENVTLLSLKND